MKVRVAGRGWLTIAAAHRARARDRARQAATRTVAKAHPEEYRRAYERHLHAELRGLTTSPAPDATEGTV